MCNMYEIIEQLCRERGIKPGRLCADIGISRGIMGDLKAGRTKRLSAENLGKVSAYFGVSSDYLLGAEAKKDASAPEGGRALEDEELKAAFWGGERDLTPGELDELWEDVREYARYKAEQRRKKKQE